MGPLCPNFVPQVTFIKTFSKPSNKSAWKWCIGQNLEFLNAYYKYSQKGKHHINTVNIWMKKVNNEFHCDDALSLLQYMVTGNPYLERDLPNMKTTKCPDGEKWMFKKLDLPKILAQDKDASSKSKCTLQSEIEITHLRQRITDDDRIKKERYYYHGPDSGCHKWTWNPNEKENTSFASESECFKHCEPEIYLYECKEHENTNKCQKYLKKDKDGNPQTNKTCDAYGNKNCCACGRTYVEVVKPKVMKAPCMTKHVANAEVTDGTCTKPTRKEMLFANPKTIWTGGECQMKIVKCHAGYKIPMADENDTTVLDEFQYYYHKEEQKYITPFTVSSIAELECGQGCVEADMANGERLIL